MNTKYIVVEDYSKIKKIRCSIAHLYWSHIRGNNIYTKETNIYAIGIIVGYCLAIEKKELADKIYNKLMSL